MGPLGSTLLAPSNQKTIPSPPAHNNAVSACAHPHPPWTAVLILEIVPAVYAAFDRSLHWTIFVVVSIIEPSTGK